MLWKAWLKKTKALWTALKMPLIQGMWALFWHDKKLSIRKLRLMAGWQNRKEENCVKVVLNPWSKFHKKMVSLIFYE